MRSCPCGSCSHCCLHQGCGTETSIEYAKHPFKHTTTDNLIGVIGKALKDMEKETQHIGRKTLLLREAGFVVLALKGGKPQSQHAKGAVESKDTTQ